MPFVQSLNLAHLPPDLAVHIALYSDLQNAPFLRDQLLQGNPDYEYALIDASVVRRPCLEVLGEAMLIVMDQIVSTTHVLAAVFRAANDYLNGRLKSRNVHSEIVFSLGANNNVPPLPPLPPLHLRLKIASPNPPPPPSFKRRADPSNKQIAQSLRTFGIAATTTNLLAIKLSTSPSITASTVSEHLAASVQGTAVHFSDAALATMADVDKIRKLYKLSGVREADHKGKRRRKDGSEEGSGGGGGGEGGGDTGDGAEEERRELEGAVLGLMALRGAV